MSTFLSPAAMEAAFGVTPHPEFTRIVERARAERNGHWASLPDFSWIVEVWFAGEAIESFVREDWPDEDRDGLPYGHPSATEIDFESLPGWLPLATIGDEESRVLLCKADLGAGEVAMWTEETVALVHVAETLEAFLKTLRED